MKRKRSLNCFASCIFPPVLATVVDAMYAHCQSHPFEVRPIIPILSAMTTAFTRSSV